MSTQPKPLASGLRALRPRARIIQALGEDLISNQVIALIELIKNAYDADAHKVDIRFESPLQKGKGAIVVQDDGHGMSIDILKNAWMEPATDAKTGKLTSPGGRRFTGEKGLGRFAASRLADRMCVESVARKPLRRVTADFNWSKFKQTNKYLDQIKCSWKEFKAPRGSNTGTLLRLVGLRDGWDEKEFVRLRAELARLVSRDNSQADWFEISLHLPSAFREHTGPVTPPPVLSRANFSMEGSVSSEGHLAAKMKAEGKQKPIDLEIKLEKGRKPISGSFTFRFEVWERERDNLIKLVDELGSTLRDLRRDLDAACGISIYRDVFRVLPYGGPDNDWLRLDIRRVQNPTLRFSNNQIVGSVRITRDENPELRDQTNREGIVESQAFDDLRACVKEALSSLEAWRFQYRREPAKEDMGEGLFHEFDIEPIKVGFQERHPEDKEFIKYLDERARKVKKSVEKVQNVLVRYRRLATLGQLIDVVLHEGRTPVTALSNECDLGLRVLKKARTLGALQDSVVAWIGAEMEFALSQAVASGDTFEHRPSECGHCVQDFLADLDLRDLPGEAAGSESGADDALPPADLRFYPAALVVPCGRLPGHAAVAADLGNMAIPNGWIPRRLRSDHCVLRRRYNHIQSLPIPFPQQILCGRSIIGAVRQKARDRGIELIQEPG